MKRTKRLTAVLLSVLTAFSAFTMLSASAAETDEQSVAAQTDVQVVAAQAEEQAVAATEATESSVGAGASVEIGQVTGLTKNTTNVNNINLVWNKVSGANGYVIYSCSADYGTEFTKIAEVTTNTYNHTGLVQGSPYHYKVAAYKIVNGEKIEGEPTLYKTATQPSKVTGLGRVRSSDTIEISWNRNEKATGYKVFRASAATNNQYELVKLIDSGTVTRYIDTNVTDGGIYTYKVVAFRVNYTSCWYHSPGSVLTCMSGLCAPNFNFSTQLYRVSLNWKKNKYATRYDIYYSTDKNAVKYTPAGSTTGNSFVTDTRFANGAQLYFRVYPIYKKNGVTITGTAHTKLVTITNKIYGVAAPTTYVEIDIAQQRMWLVKNGKVIVDTPVVTGTKGYNDTPKGYYTMYSRAMDTVLYGDDYASPVDYWMGFKGGYGIHDASWRSSYGGNIYTYNGSHGCVNTPYNAVKTIYNNTAYGTPVILY